MKRQVIFALLFFSTPGWAFNISAGGSGATSSTPAGSDAQFQINQSTGIGASSNLFYDYNNLSSNGVQTWSPTGSAGNHQLNIASDGNISFSASHTGANSGLTVFKTMGQTSFLNLTGTGQFCQNFGSPTCDDTAMMDLRSTTQGVAFPNMTSTQRQAISSPRNSLMVYDTDSQSVYSFENSSWTALGVSLRGTSASIGGSALIAGQCSTATVTVNGATASMVAVASPASDPDSNLSAGLALYSFVSSANTVTIRVCAIVTVTPTAVAYNVRVIR